MREKRNYPSNPLRASVCFERTPNEDCNTMTHNPERVILDVDERGRVSLGKLGFRSMQLVADTTSDGGLILHPAVAMTPAEAAHYRDPEAVRLFDQAMLSASQRRLKDFDLRSDPSPPGE